MTKKPVKIKEVKHRHKWHIDYSDCIFCGGGEYKWCEDCTETRDMKNKIIYN